MVTSRSTLVANCFHEIERQDSLVSRITPPLPVDRNTLSASFSFRRLSACWCRRLDSNQHSLAGRGF